MENAREISGEDFLLLFPQEAKLESAQNFSRRNSRHFSLDVLQLQMPNVMAFFTLQTFVLDPFSLLDCDVPREPQGQKSPKK